MICSGIWFSIEPTGPAFAGPPLLRRGWQAVNLISIKPMFFYGFIRKFIRLLARDIEDCMKNCLIFLNNF